MTQDSIAARPVASNRSALAILAIGLGCVEVAAELATLLEVGIAKDWRDLFGGVGVEIALMAPYLRGRALVMLAMSTGLVAIGIGLRSPSERARVAAVIWSEVALALLLGRLVLWEVILWPRVDNAIRIVEGGFTSFGQLGSVVGSLLGAVMELGRVSEYIVLALLLPFPIVLVWNTSRRTRRPAGG